MTPDPLNFRMARGQVLNFGRKDVSAVPASLARPRSFVIASRAFYLSACTAEMRVLATNRFLFARFGPMAGRFPILLPKTARIVETLRPTPKRY